MLYDKTFEAHCAQILSCSGPMVSAWLTTWLVFPIFWLSSLIFCITFCTWFGLSHLSITSISQCVCTHPIDLMGIHLLRCAHGNKCARTHDVIRNTFATIGWDVGYHMGWEQLHALLVNHIQLLSSTSQHNAYQRWHLHFSWHCYCWPNARGFIFSILCNSRICYIKCKSSQGKELSQLTFH